MDNTVSVPNLTDIPNIDGTQIEGVQIIPLKIIEDDRGKVMHMIKKNSPYFNQFGEVYFSFTNPGVIKGWKLHKEMEQNFAVPVGTIKLVIFDDRDDSPTKNNVAELEIGEDNYKLVKIPPRLWYSFQAISEIPGMIVNCSTIEHDSNEVKYIDLNSCLIPYSWRISR